MFTDSESACRHPVGVSQLRPVTFTVTPFIGTSTATVGSSVRVTPFALSARGLVVRPIRGNASNETRRTGRRTEPSESYRAAP